jgi:hypothetical protein
LAWIGACFLKKKDSIAGDEAGEMERNARLRFKYLKKKPVDLIFSFIDES